MRKKITFSIIAGIIILTIVVFAVVAANVNTTNNHETTNENKTISNEVSVPPEIEMLYAWSYSFQDYGGPVISIEDGVWSVSYLNIQEHHIDVSGDTVSVSLTKTQQNGLSLKDLSDICRSIENEGGPTTYYKDGTWYIDFKTVEEVRTDIKNNVIYFYLSE